MQPSIRLVPPSVSRHGAFVDCLADFAGTALDGASIADPAAPPVHDADFVDFVTGRLAEEDPATELEEPWVHCTSRWIVSNDGSDELLGFFAIRHRLNRFLHDQGGHIGYSVRPSARRRGIATAALALGLQEARGLGIAPVLITCDESNTGSRRAIEKSGGRLENTVEGKLRFWVGDEERPTRP
ncbi:GNAT family N-acetyltransferase [Brachybacterium fresconis]|uniref:Acetyltransferase n=1 Tax=Brachybacterium fresconis TaxID=173363 RepID=A0ABS4YNS6_9MICO|nr:GNAT family N-acetyltransferase [Brachybacterium fresconis]MBP2410447.1 putative acetyltransferase [Brachybacterium fresconis]